MIFEKQQTWEDESIKGIQLSEVDFYGKAFEECEFIDSEFVGGNFRNAAFNECVFKNCNLSNLALTQSKFGEVLFSECKLVGLDFSSCKKLLFSIKLEKCIAQMCNFTGLNMSDFSFSGSEIIDCDFYETKLTSADFSHCKLKGTLFENCDLSEADFSKATEYAIDPSLNQIKKAKFSMPEVLSFLKPLDIQIEY